MDPQNEPQLESDDAVPDVTEAEKNVREALNGKGVRKVYLTRRERIREIVLAVLVVAVAIGTPVVITVRSTANGDHAALRLLCPLVKNIASSTIPPVIPGAPATVGTPTGIQNIGQMRIFYESTCSKLGPLPPVTDPRLADYLKSKGH